ncbi:FAD-dependent thymidylate synthase [Candidatus Woesearchaeota archaeon]|nr:FAD-dependent thymidylate synthase [Candidatus Woesearchaeota archaeon]
MPKEEYSPAAQKLLHYMMSHPFDRVSLLTHLPPQTKATLQSMYSRNDLPMRATLLKIIVTVDLELERNKRKFDEVTQAEKEAVFEMFAQTIPDADPPLVHLFDKKAESFLDQWAVKHGHGSIKEGAFTSYIVEGVTLITAKALEHDPLFHGQELSTRYKSFAKQRVPIPPVLDKSPLAGELRAYFERSLQDYLEASRIMNEFQATAFPAPEGISPAGWKQVLGAETFDNARYYLNAGITTSLGIVEDARTLERKLRNLLVFPFPETRDVAQEILEKGRTELTTLLKHVDPNEYKKNAEEQLALERETVMKGARHTILPTRDVALLHATPDLENRMIADLLYGEARHGFAWADVYSRVQRLSADDKKQILERAFEKLGKHDDPLSTLRGTRLAFELYPDFGAWRDIERHRRCNQSFPLPTCDYGYNTPWLVGEAGLAQHYKDHMERAADVFEKARKVCPEEAVIVPALGFKVKQTIDGDIDEWVYIWRLRTTPYGHFSYRKIFQETFRAAKPHIPLLADIIERKQLIDMNGYHHGRLVEEQRFEAKMKLREGNS